MNDRKEGKQVRVPSAYGWLISAAIAALGLLPSVRASAQPVDAPHGFALIPAGSFMMGSPSIEQNRDHDEQQHRVTLTHAFFMQTHEVTQGQYEALMGINPSSLSSCGDDCPVELVSWLDAVAYANALSSDQGFAACYEITGETVTVVGGDVYACEGYRLPTEAEWEYVARAGTTTAFYNGDAESGIGGIAWHAGNANETTHEVGQLQANAWGLQDMSGNVWEWCWDWYSDYAAGSQTDPTGASNGSNRITRGGSWYNATPYLRSASRSYFSPSRRFTSIGFRLARSAQ